MCDATVFTATRHCSSEDIEGACVESSCISKARKLQDKRPRVSQDSQVQWGSGHTFKALTEERGGYGMAWREDSSGLSSRFGGEIWLLAMVVA